MPKECMGPECPGCDSTGCYAKGGEVDDGEALVDECASECMKAIESGDKAMFRQSLEALVSDIVMKMQEMPDADGT